MSIGGAGGNTVSFGIKAIADLRGIEQTAQSLKNLAANGGQAGQGIASGMSRAETGLAGVTSHAEAAAASLAKIAAASAGALIVGKALFEIGENFEKATDIIRVGTGATGAALKSLSDDATAVFEKVPASLTTVATALTEISQRTGDTGAALQELTQTEIELARVTGTDLAGNITNSTKLFQQWNVAVDQQVPTLDKLLRASQATGIGVDQLGAELVQFSPILQTMGFSLDQSIAFLAALDKAGVDATSVITGLRIATKKFADEGVTDVSAALSGVFDQIKKAPTDLAAATVAIDIFGARAGPALANNIRSGRLSYDDLLKDVSGGSETINKAAQDTQHFSEKLQILKNNAEVAAKPLGDALIGALNQLLPVLEQLAKGVELVSSAFEKLPGPIRDAVGLGVGIIGLVAGISVAASALKSVVTNAAEAFAGLAGSMVKVAGAGADAASGIAEAGAAAAVATPEVDALAASEDVASASADGMGISAAASAGGLGAAGTALGGLATKFGPVIAGLVAVKLGMDTLTSIQTGGTSGLEGWAEKAGIGITHGFAWAAGELPFGVGQGVSDSLNKSADDRALGDQLQNTLKGAGYHLDTDYGVLGGLDVKIKELNETVGDFNKAQQASGLSVDDYIAKLKAQADAASLAARAAQNNKTIQQESDDEATKALQDQADASIKAKDAQDQLNKTIQDTQNETFLASAQAQGLYLPFTRNATDAQKATEEFNTTLDGITQSALYAEQGLGDISSQLPGMQTGFGKVGDSITDIVRKMDDLGVINLSAPVRQALDAVSTLDAVQKKIDGVDASIKQNQGDMSMWQGRITLVTDAFGANSQQIGEWQKELENGTITQDQFNAAVASLGSSGGFPRLDALLAQGKISHDEYNKAVDAGTFLLQRSAGGLQDEDAQIVQNIIDLANYAKAHDTADGAVKKLSSSQREYVAAMADSKTQTFLQTLQLLTYLASVKQIPPEAVTKFIADSAQADPVIKGIAQDLGLIPPDKTTTIVVDAKTEDAQKKIKDLNNTKVDGKTVKIDIQTIDAVGKLKAVEGAIVDVTANGKVITVTADTKDAAQKFLDLNKNDIAKLDGRELVVRVKGDDGKWQTVKDHIIKETIPDKTVTVKVAAALPAATGAGIPLTGGNLLGNLKDVSISITAEDKTKPGTDAAKTSLDTFSTNAATQGNTAGQNWGDGVSSGMGASSGAIASGVAAVAQTLDFSSAAFNYGFNDGWNFGIGEANGIAATWNDVFNAAFNVGYAAYVGNQAGMQAHSPSKLALAAGKNWGDSIADGIRSAAGNVHAAANALAGGLPTQFASPATQLAMRSALTSDSRTQAVLAGSSGRGSTTIHHVQTINQTLNFHGITDTTAIVNEVHTQTYRALDRGQAAGLFGS